MGQLFFVGIWTFQWQTAQLTMLEKPNMEKCHFKLNSYCFPFSGLWDPGFPQISSPFQLIPKFSLVTRSTEKWKCSMAQPFTFMNCLQELNLTDVLGRKELFTADYITPVRSSKLKQHYSFEFQNTEWLFQHNSGLLGDDLLSKVITPKHKSKCKLHSWLHNVFPPMFSF